MLQSTKTVLQGLVLATLGSSALPHPRFLEKRQAWPFRSNVVSKCICSVCTT